ncbi:hypothetical protein K402DRAFT_201241 [Aulographum hederae CBS 113979]|uniref:Uncharacterized protein n=1 Tax=Aulographum hederae CBS 113979 TaxID=1176131 RepID=A0A6G1HBY0_9PEZI|nr:hypothetical protein K402DRAFT_201241 [Aulographum hederae CBS 113979]
MEWETFEESRNFGGFISKQDRVEIILSHLVIGICFVSLQSAGRLQSMALRWLISASSNPIVIPLRTFNGWTRMLSLMEVGS